MAHNIPFHERIDVYATRLVEAAYGADNYFRILDMRGFTHREAQLAKPRDYRLADLAATLLHVCTSDDDVLNMMHTTLRNDDEAQY